MTVREAVAANANLPAKPTVAQTVARLIEQQRGQIARALPMNMDPERFARIVITECKRNPTLLECDPTTLLGAVMLAAQLGLEPGPLGHFYLVPFRNKKSGRREVQPIIGYKGYIELTRRSGQVLSIVARPVHAADRFSYRYGSDEHIDHVPASANRGPAVYYYGVAKFKDGGQLIHVMSREDVDVFRKRSAASSAGPWVTDYDAMAAKTVIRRMVPFLPLTVEAAHLVTGDERPLILDSDGDVIELDEPEPEPEPAGETVETTATEAPAE